MAQTNQNCNRDLAYETALRLHCEFGFNVFPLKPKDKKPYEGFTWKRWQTDRVTEDQIEQWHDQFPGCNWAIVCGPISDLVVVDCDDPGKDGQWCREHLPATPLHVTTGKGFHAYYRYPTGWDSKLNALNLRSNNLAIDLRRTGNYVVAPGSVHPSGTIYKEHIEGPWDAVPVFPVASLCGETPLDVDLDEKEIFREGERNARLASIAGQLIHQGWDEPAMRSELKRINRELCQPPLPEYEVNRIASSIWREEKKNHPATTGNGQTLLANAEDFSDVELDNSDPTDIPVPDIILRPDGLLGQIANYISNGAVRTHPLFSFAGALSCLATLAGQKIQTNTGKTTNLYIICIGNSSSGKDAPKSGIKRLFDAVNSFLYAGSDVSSDVAILNHLAENNCQRGNLCLDEIGMFLKSTKQPNSAKAGVIKLLTELYSCTKNYVKLYADQEKNKTVAWHALNLLGLSVPEEFYGALQTGETTNGFLARLLVFDASFAAPSERNFNLQTQIPEELYEALVAIDKDLNNCPKRNALGQQLIDPVPEPITLELDPDAKRFFLAKVKEWDELQVQFEHEGKNSAASLAGRISELALQTALVFALSRHGHKIQNNPAISLQDMERAWDVVEFCVKSTIERIENSIADNDFDALVKNIKKAIRTYVRREARLKAHANKPGAPKAFILKAVPGVPLDLFDKAINRMIAANELRVEKNWRASANSRRVLELYCLTRELEVEDVQG